MRVAAKKPPVADVYLGRPYHSCRECGAPVDDIDEFCNGCGAEQKAVRDRVAKAGAATAERPQRVFKCENCGAEVAVDPEQRSYTCAFCDSNYVVELPPRETERQPPEFVLGFAITLEQAGEKFRQWLGRRSLFRPGDLASAIIAEKLKGVYLPFWSFSMLARAEWEATIGEYWYRTETYTTVENGKTVTKTRTVRETEWWPLAGKFHRYYSGYLVSGSSGLPQQYADAIKPFQIAALKRYEPYFLAGWLAEEYTVEREQAETTCRQEFQRWVQQHVDQFMPGDTHRGLSMDVRFSDITSDLILLPIYLVSYRYGETVYRWVLNGQTGRMYGDKPVSWQRIGAAIATVIVIALIIWLIVMLSS
jgi:hypothetical protein